MNNIIGKPIVLFGWGFILYHRPWWKDERKAHFKKPIRIVPYNIGKRYIFFSLGFEIEDLGGLHARRKARAKEAQ